MGTRLPALPCAERANGAPACAPAAAASGRQARRRCQLQAPGPAASFSAVSFRAVKSRGARLRRGLRPRPGAPTAVPASGDADPFLPPPSPVQAAASLLHCTPLCTRRSPNSLLTGPQSPKKSQAKNLSSRRVTLRKSQQGCGCYPRCGFARAFCPPGADRDCPCSSSLWRIRESVSTPQNEPRWSKALSRELRGWPGMHPGSEPPRGSPLQHESPLGSTLLRAGPWTGGAAPVPRGTPKLRDGAAAASAPRGPVPKCQMRDTSLAGRKGKRSGLSDSEGRTAAV